MSKGPVVVTGSTGVLGSHVVLHLLEEGYIVRCAARPGKASKLRDTYPHAGTALEVYEVADINGDFSKPLEGAVSLIHCAAPNYIDGSTPAQILAGGRDGTINIIEQAIKAGIKKIVATSSLVTLFNSDFQEAMTPVILTENSWNDLTSPKQLNTNNLPGMVVYLGAKTLGERAVWEIAAKNKDVDFTTIVPPGIYGRILGTFPRPNTISGLAAIAFIHDLLTSGPDAWPNNPISESVSLTDCARAHVIALSKGPLPDGKNKRLLVSNGRFTWPEAAELLRKERSELSARLPRPDVPHPPQTQAILDTSLAEDVLGIKTWIPWQQALLEAADSVIAWERSAPGAQTLSYVPENH